MANPFTFDYDNSPNLTPEEIELAKKPLVTSDSEIKKGAAGFVDQTQALGGGIVGLAGEKLGLPGVRDWGLDVYNKNMEEATQGWQRPAVPTVEDIKFSEPGGVGRAVDWAENAGTQGVMNLATMAVGGGVGGAIGKSVAKSAVKEAAGIAAAAAAKRAAGGALAPAVEGVAEAAAKKVADAGLKGRFYGGFAGAAAGNTGMEAGGAFGQMVQDGVSPEKAATPALAYGLASNIAEFGPEFAIAKATGLDKGLKQWIREWIESDSNIKNRFVRALAGAGTIGAGGAALEGGTESVQQLMQIGAERWAKQDPMFAQLSDEDKSAILNAGAAGALTGGLVGGAGGSVKGFSAKAAKAAVDAGVAPPQQEVPNEEAGTAAPAAAQAQTTPQAATAGGVSGQETIAAPEQPGGVAQPGTEATAVQQPSILEEAESIERGLDEIGKGLDSVEEQIGKPQQFPGSIVEEGEDIGRNLDSIEQGLSQVQEQLSRAKQQPSIAEEGEALLRSFDEMDAEAERLQQEIDRLKGGSNAQQEQVPAPVDGSGSAQPTVREEGGRATEGGERVQPSGQGEQAAVAGSVPGTETLASIPQQPQHTTSSIRQSVEKELGADWLHAAEQRGLVEILDEVGPQGIQAEFNRNTNKITIYARSVQGDPSSVVLHEGSHQSLDVMLHGRLGEFAKEIVKQAKRDPKGQAAAAVARAQASVEFWKQQTNNGASSQMTAKQVWEEEIFAYFVEHAKEGGLFRRAINAIKAGWIDSAIGRAFAKAGLSPKMTDGVAAALARRAVKFSIGLHDEVQRLKQTATQFAESTDNQYTLASRIGKSLGISPLVTGEGDDVIIGYRGGDVSKVYNESSYGGTEGEGIYLTGDKELAEFFGKVREIKYKEPRNPFVVKGENSPLLDDEDPVLFEPLAKGDSDWIRRNKVALQQAVTAGETSEQNWDSRPVSRRLTKGLKQDGYDAVFFEQSPGYGWVVLLDPELVQNWEELSEKGQERDGDKLASFIGKKAKGGNSQWKAEDLLRAGISPDRVRKETGWFLQPDGGWRFEIDSSKMRVLDDEALTLGDVIEYPALFAAYPEFKDIKFVRNPENDTQGGSAYYSQSENKIYVPYARTGEALRDALLHEIQHAIQYIEGWSQGTNYSYVGDERYYRDLGEIEARNVVARKDLTYRERKKKSPLLTQDIPSSEAYTSGTWSLPLAKDDDRMKGVGRTNIKEGTDADVVSRLRAVYARYGQNPLKAYEDFFDIAQKEFADSKISLDSSPGVTDRFSKIVITPDVLRLRKWGAPTNEPGSYISPKELPQRLQLVYRYLKELSQGATKEGYIPPKSWDEGRARASEMLSDDGLASLASFAGPRAATANYNSLEAAQEFIDEGVDPEQVRQTTGWFRGDDGKWRFEIDDSAAKLIGSDGSLGEVLDHPRLFAAYPQLQYVQVEVKIEPGNRVKASFNHNTFEIKVAAPDEENALSALLHEVQHVVQKEEGFARGGGASLFKPGGALEHLRQTDETPNQAYMRLAGEVEARNVQARQRMTEEERRAIGPDVTRDVAKEQVVFKERGDSLASLPQQEPGPLWRSGTLDAIRSIKQNKASGEQWLNMLTQRDGKTGQRVPKLPGVSVEEMEDMGLVDWLESREGAVGKDEVEGFVRDGGVRVEEVVKGGLIVDKLPETWKVQEVPGPYSGAASSWKVFDDNNSIAGYGNSQEEAIASALRGLSTEEGNTTKFGQYQLPGGANYRELLITIPANSKEFPGYEKLDIESGWPEADKIDVEKGDRGWNTIDKYGILAGVYATREEAVAHANELAKEIWNKGKEGTSYKSSHWSEPNVLVHLRFNERTDADGKKVLLVEEVQSDLQQEYRKKTKNLQQEIDTDFEGLVARIKAQGDLIVDCA